jgi:acyl-CoA thioesterase YciA
MNADSATPPQIEPAIRTITMPADANANGDIFGGWLLSQMDLAGASVAGRRSNSRVATVAITGMSFRRPVYIGDEISCYATVVKVGHTSLTVKVESWVRRSRGIGDDGAIAVTEGIFTYVAIGADGAPRPVPPEK